MRNYMQYSPNKHRLAGSPRNLLDRGMQDDIRREEVEIVIEPEAFRSLAKIKPVRGDEWRYVLGERTTEAISEDPQIKGAIGYVFNMLIKTWRDETGHISIPKRRQKHPAYQALLSLGKNYKEILIPLLLEEFREDPYGLVEALEYVTEENPLEPGDIGEANHIVAAWLKWGKEQGYDIK